MVVKNDPSYHRAYYMRHRVDLLLKSHENRKRYRLAHGPEQAERVRTWRRARPERMQVYNARRRARKLAQATHFTHAEWVGLKSLHALCCFYCGERKPLEPDHNIPLARGGGDHIGNILPACRNCNSRKSTKTAREFLELVA